MAIPSSTVSGSRDLRGSGERENVQRTALIGTDADACRECWRCVRACPARAIRVVDGAVEVLDDRCVSCGLCVSECPHGGHFVRNDGDLVDALLASGRPVVAVLATEFVAAMHPLTPLQVETALESMGFHAVESTLLGEEMVALQYEARHAVRSGLPVIRATCPVVNDWVRKYHPALVGALAPVVPPYVAQARLVKSLYPADTAVVYVSPCYARKNESSDPRFEGAVDAAIDFLELRSVLDRAGGAAEPSRRAARARVGSRRPEPLKELSLTDGFPRSTLVARDMTASDVKVVRGLAELDRLLRAIEAGEAAPEIIDALNCESCIAGPAVNPGMSLFAKRDVDASERRRRARSSVPSRELLRHLPAIDLRRAFTPAPVRRSEPTRAQIDASLAEGGIRGADDALDCGACGDATCYAHARAVVRGEATWETCVPLRRRRLRHDGDDPCAPSGVDELTRLFDRRVLMERLAEEVARNQRYSTAASLLVIDIDGFEQLNRADGREAGDSVLVAVADAIRSALRTSDVPARCGGDQFSVILPGIGKTDAFAVAEKLRLSIAEMPVEVGRNGTRREVFVRVSVGVAACRAGVDAAGVVSAADRALYQAKRSGQDQVRIAPG